MKEINRRDFRHCVKLLAKVKPDWYKRISMKRLDLECIKNCVLAQLFKGFSEGMNAIGADWSGRNDAFADNTYKPLWIAEIKKLRAKDKLKAVPK